MARAHLHKPQHPTHDVPGEFEPGAPPVEPDEGPVPPVIPEDPEHERVIAPGPKQNAPTQRTLGQVDGDTPLLKVRAPRSPAGLPLPHERDESTDTTAEAPDPMMIQAKRDIDAGMVDTDMRATPGLDSQRRASLVPGPGGTPPSSDD